MGTKVQSKTYFPGYHSMRDLNNNPCNGMWDLYREDKTLENNQYSFMTRPVIDGYEGYEKEQIRQTILKQESVFKHQLQELHRLCKKQRNLMNECTRKELHNHPTVAAASKPSLFSSQFPSENSKELPHVLNFPFVGPSFGRVSTLGTDGIIHPPFAFEKEKCVSQRRTFDLELPADSNDEGIRQKDKIPDLADLNEPIQVEETSSSVSLNNFRNKAFLQEELLRRDACRNSSSGFWFSPQGFSQNLFAGMTAGIHPNDKQLGSERNVKEQSTYNCKAGNTRPHERSYIHSDHSSTVSNLVQVEPGKARESLPSSVTDQAKTEPQQKRTLFGVDISEGSYQLSSNASQAPNSHLSNSLSNVIKSESTFSLPWGKTPVISGKNILALQDNSLQDYSSFNFGFPSYITSKNSANEHFVQLDPTENYKGLECASLMPPDTQKHDNCEKGLPWLFAKPHSCAEQNNGKGSLYQMNLDSLQNNSPQFFKKAETMRCPTQVLSKDSSSLICARDSESVKEITNECQKVTKKIGFPVFDVPDISGLRHHIDLNLALNEEESPLATSFSKAVVKIATTEIDLEVPAVLDPEEENSQKSNSMEPPSPKLPLDSLTDSQEEIAKVAAEAIMTISSLSYKSMETSASDSLLWFADVVSSDKVNEDLVKVKPYDAFDEESNIPEGMDEFELMTLKLKDTKEEEYCYKPMVFENENSGVPTKRPRRGQGKRGKQKKDFQRDILPSLVSLARREVTEDLQTFEEAFTVLGDPWQSSMSKKKAARNSRGRKRLVDPTPPAVPIANAVSPPPPTTMQATCREVALEEKSLSGWGKRTRRLPRQRCINNNNSSSPALALKC